MPESESLSRRLPGVSSSVGLARAALRGFLGETPRTHDAELLVSELATNSVRHSASRDEGGEFELRIEAKGGRLRIEVVDQGRPVRSALAVAVGEKPGPADYRESGRGLVLVDGLSDTWGYERHPDHALYWAELWIDEEAR